MIQLNCFNNFEFNRGRSIFVESIWIIIQKLFVSSWIPGSYHRCFLLRLFGANIGHKVNIKPGVKIKFPWKLSIGEFSWIGENVWIDNLSPVNIGKNCCISQGAYLCTGSHDWSHPHFNLITKSIIIENGAWIAAKSIIAPGVFVGEGAILTLGSIATKDMEKWMIYCGNPAKPLRKRVML